ncbi:MAG: RNA-binding protein [Aestuariivirga sp.]
MPERTCIVTREAKDETGLIRFVRSPEGRAVPDLARKLPGRGVWVGLSRDLVGQAVSGNLFSRGFKAQTAADADLPDQVASLLRRHTLGYLGMARKAGEAVTGFAKVEEMAGKGKAAALIHAADASPDQNRKLDKFAGEETAIVNLFGGVELDLAFGRSNVVHAALARGRIAENFLAGVRRIESYGTSAVRQRV